MLDAAFIRDNEAAVRANCKNRGADTVPVDRIVTFDKERRRLIQAIETQKRDLTDLLNALAEPLSKLTSTILG